METLLKIIHVMVCIFLMLTVLLQAGKGGGMGAAFGGGTSMGSVFGGSGAGTFLRKLTVIAAAVFMLTSMTLAWMSTPDTDPLEQYWAQQQKAALERDRAHMQALDGDDKDKAEDKEDGAGDGELTTPEGVEGGETGAVDPQPAIDTPEGDVEPVDPAEMGGGLEEAERKAKEAGGIVAPLPEDEPVVPPTP
jgi:preprotein translocase subunit SecG